MCKNFILILLLGISTNQGLGQTTVTTTMIPPFSLLLTTGKHYSNQDIQKNKALLLIYFEPGCDHCRDFTKKLTAKMKDFSTAQILMISYVPIQPMQQFYKDFLLQQYPNIKVGTEENKFVIPNHFKIIKFPFTAIYHKTNNPVAIFREEPSLDEVAALLKKK